MTTPNEQLIYLDNDKLLSLAEQCPPLEPFITLECFPKGIVAQLVEALRLIAAQQPKTLQTLRDNGFVFDDIGSEPGNWQHAAFTVYSDLCEVDRWARAVLAAFDAKETT